MAVDCRLLLLLPPPPLLLLLPPSPPLLLLLLLSPPLLLLPCRCAWSAPDFGTTLPPAYTAVALNLCCHRFRG